MTDIVVLEIPAEPSLLSVVRMVVGGMAARVDLSVDEIDDVYMALEEVFWAAQEKGSARRCSMRISAVEGSLTMELGPFDSPSVARRLEEPACALLARVVAFEVREGPGDQTSVVLTKRREVIGG
jgi:hypothetical protein